MNDNVKELARFPKPPEGISLLKVEDIVLPHPYCITPKHLEFNEGMVLDIEAAERKSKEKHPYDTRKQAVCEICKKKRYKFGTPILTLEEHKKSKTLFIEVQQNKDLNADLNSIPGLREYLLQIKPIAERLHIKGFAFPKAGD